VAIREKRASRFLFPGRLLETSRAILPVGASSPLPGPRESEARSWPPPGARGRGLPAPTAPTSRRAHRATGPPPWGGGSHGGGGGGSGGGGGGDGDVGTGGRLLQPQSLAAAKSGRLASAYLSELKFHVHAT
jgi:hypothetical protein